MKKTILLVLSLLLLAGALFANGTQPASSSSSSAASTQGVFNPNTRYTVSIGCFGDLEAAYTAVIGTDDFRARYPNVTITFQTADFGGHHNRLTTVIAAGEATNSIEAVEVGYIAAFVASGGLTNLAAAPFNAYNYTQDTVQFAVSNARTTDNQLVAFPVDIAPAVLFYRRDLCAARGVSEAEMQNIASWDAYIAIGRRLTIPGTQWAVSHPGDVALVPLNGGKGGWFDRNGNPLAPRARFMASLNLVQAIRAAGIDANYGAWSDPWTQGFANGQLLTMVNGAWFGGALRTWMAPEVTDWRVAYLPGRAPASFGGSYLCIPQSVSAADKTPAWEILKYLCTSPVAQLTTFARVDAYPALTTVYSDPMMSEGVPYFGGQQVRLIYADVARTIPANAVSRWDVQIVGIWNNTITAVINGEMTPDQAYASALQQVQAIIQ